MTKTFRVGGLELDSPLMLAAGVCKDPRHTIPYMREGTALGAIVAGSLTLEFRSGNKGTVQWPSNWTEFLSSEAMLNSYGLPSPGLQEGLERLQSTVLSRPIIVSYAGFSVQEVATGIKMMDEISDVSAIEVNLGCGNTGGLPFAYSFATTQEILQALEILARRGRLTKPVWLKLSPYITKGQRRWLSELRLDIDFSLVPVVDPGFVEGMVQMICRYPFVRAVVFSNTLPFCRKLGRDGKPVTTPFDGKAGLSGPLLKPISLELIQRAQEALPTFAPLDFIGCGGIIHGDDAADYLDIGAKAVQFASAALLRDKGHRFPNELVSESERLQRHFIAD